jgi:CBS domain-containing protein
MRISECMTRGPHVTAPDQTICEAACVMAEIDAGMLPVGQDGRLVGIVTDRDIAVRGIAKGKGPETSVREVMSSDVLYCFEDQDVSEVLENMGEIQVRRLPVLSRDKRLTGIVSLCDFSSDDVHRTGAALNEITRPSGQRSQAL